jgi:hypothetical protein
MKYLIEMNQTDSGYEIKYKEDGVVKTSTFTTQNDAMLFINELNLTGV